MNELTEWLALPWVQTGLGLVALVAACWLTATVVRRALARAFRAVARRTSWTWDDVLIEHGTLRQITRIAPFYYARPPGGVERAG